MTAIDALLKKAGELSGASLSEFGPVLDHMAEVQASLAEALAPLYQVMAVPPEMEPFRYGFVLPAEPPEVKVDQGEKPADAGKAGVSIGPINVYAITQEIQKALDGVGRDTIDIPAFFSNNIAPPALQELKPSGSEPQPTFRPGPAPVVEGRREVPALGKEVEPVWRPKLSEAEQRDTNGKERSEAPAGTKESGQSSAEWIERSVRRSTVVMNSLTEVSQNIMDRTITAEKVREISAGSLSITPAITAGSEARSGLDKQPAQAEPARVQLLDTKPDQLRPPVGGETGVVQPLRAGPTATADFRRETAKPVQTQERPREPERQPVIPNVVQAPPIRPRRKIVAPAEEAEYNATKLAEALTQSASGGRESAPVDRKPEPAEKPVRIEWPQPPQQAARTAGTAWPARGDAGREARQPGTTAQPVEARRAEFGVTPSTYASAAVEPGLAFASSPVAQVSRSFGAMNEYLRTVAEIGARGLPESTGAAPVSAGAMIVNAMAGMSAAAPASLPSAGEAPVAGLQRALTMHAPPPLPAAQEGQQSDIRHIWAAGSPVATSGPGQRGAVVQGSQPPARHVLPAIGLAANIAAAQTSQRAGVSMIRQLVQSTPQVAGSIIPQAATAYEGFSGLPMSQPISPAAASGAENIVNVTVPQAAGRVGESSTTHKVSNFHNTFNITVTVKGGEERDLKDLGRKIGQILSDEMKRYGGI